MMKNEMLKKDYEMYRDIREAYNKAKETGDERLVESAKKMYKSFYTGSIESKDESYKNLFDHYCKAMERGNKYIDVSWNVWDNAVEPLISMFREYGVEHFTFSCGYSSAVETAWKFTELGCELEGIVELNGIKAGYDSDDWEKIHGYLFRVH